MYVKLADLKPAEKQGFLQHAIAPRPIAFASTINEQGLPNLSPFSFFNLFSANPPIVVFSPSRRVRDNTIKHTLENVQQTGEVVIGIVDYDMVQQVSLSSCEYPDGVNEFEKAGFTQAAATLVKPYLIAESKINLECKVLEIKSLGDTPGAGNLVICEVLAMHIKDEILNADGSIDQQKIEHVARCGGDWYVRSNEQSLFIVPKPNRELGIGIDALPSDIKNSTILTGNHLGMLANVTTLPVIDPAFEDKDITSIIQYFSMNPGDMDIELHKHAAKLLNSGKVHEAWQTLLIDCSNL